LEIRALISVPMAHASVRGCSIMVAPVMISGATKDRDPQEGKDKGCGCY
jgi:hypothetical protein